MSVAAWTALIDGDHGVSREAKALRDALRASRRGTAPGAILFRRLWDLEQVFEDASSAGWDGYGADPVTQETFDTAKRFIEALPNTWPAPEISADPDGEITFEWGRGPDMVFAVSIGASDLADYAGLFGRVKIHGREVLSELPKVVLDNLARLFPRSLRSAP